ncbi:hypothetical protein BN59_02006 [Legionella massiliensis]|uniref:Uncharacterized protein n=1 Tax=Legionella massiliensis TaxID=1034943 RepID=A0A078KXK8_9GAMM|nr:hypothetical protein BN59_02006 [Legionella massiliensis]CEE13454.1 hypothetical protein BN1094_02006 [Legionella massiliensis]
MEIYGLSEQGDAGLVYVSYIETARHPERSEGSPECGTVLIPEILRCALDDGGIKYINH